ncbi:MAG: type III-B CRISPR module RAMP protein Cmr6 [Bacteroidota bacterium]
MPTGILLIQKTKKGFRALLDRQNDRPPMPLSFLRVSDDRHHGSNCEYRMDKGKITSLKILPDGPVLHPRQGVVARHPRQKRDRQQANSRLGSNQYRISAETCYLPADSLRHIRASEIDNCHLKLNKTVNFRQERNRKKPVLFQKQDRKGNSFSIMLDFRRTEPLLQELHTRQAKQLTHLSSSHVSKDFQADWRTVAGIGGESVYETSLCLHPLYGIPYLPSSAIKGLIRSSILLTCFRDEENIQEHLAMRHPLFAALFGCDGSGLDKRARQGSVRFLDALPLSAPRIEADLINPHYPAYQNGNSPPAGWQDPIPVPFLTLSPQDAHGHPLRFRFCMYVHSDEAIGRFEGYEHLCLIDGHWREGLSPQSSLLDVCVYWLGYGLQMYGIGAKTAVGYGYLSS